MSFNFNLPDFRYHSGILNLLHMMGINEVHLRPIRESEFVRTVTRTVKRKLSESEISKFESDFSEGIEFVTSDISSDKSNGLLQLNGRTCCIYIKNQRSSYRYNSNGYKYHLFECTTIQNMIEEGRKGRYVATSRHDGKFKVVKQYNDKFIETEEKLGLCYHCLQILRSKGWDKNFNLKDFFEQHKNRFSEDYTIEETVTAKEQYAPSQKELAKKYKEQVRFKCSCCKLDCSENHSLLHLHHKDGDGQNNIYTNLEVLCVACHSQQPHHSQMLTKFAGDISKCKEMQRRQGII